MDKTRVVLDNQDFLCPICLELLKAPVTIPCGHNYCSHCIREYWLRSSAQHTVRCPQCRQAFTPVPCLGPNIMLADTVKRLRTAHNQAASAAAPVSTDANIPPRHVSRYQASNAHQQPSSGSNARNVQQQQASVSTARNVQQQHASVSTAINVQQQRASVSTVRNVQQQRAPVSTARNVQERASVSTDRNAQQQRASVSTARNVQQQRASVSTARNVQQQRASISTARNVQQQRASVSTARNVQQQRASVSTARNVQQQRASVSTARNVQQQQASVSTARNVQQQRASVSSDRTPLLPNTSGPTASNPQCERCERVQCAHVLAMLLACVAFSVAVDSAVDGTLVMDEPMAKWCIFTWGFSFSASALVLLVELCGLQSRLPMSWEDFTITFTSYASLLCLSSTIIFGVHFVRDFSGSSYTSHVTTLVFSCFATITYLTQVIRAGYRIRQDRSAQHGTGFMATGAGLLKVCETFVAGVIFVFISEPNAYESHAAVKWCMAVYCICFLLSSMVILLCIGKCTNSSLFTCQPIYALLAVMMYLTATIIWPIYKFDKHHRGNSTRSIVCNSNPELCPFDKLIIVAVLTCVNFSLYLADLIYICRQ